MDDERTMGFYLGRTHQNLLNYLSHEFKEFNITPEQWILLNILKEKDGISQKELAVKSGKKQTTITRALDNLYKKNYIQREAAADDRRVFLIFLTDEGSHLIEQLTPIAHSLLEEIFSEFSQEEVNQLKMLLIKLNGAIDQKFGKVR